MTKYTQGEAAKYAAPYQDLGIDVGNLLKEAEIAQYTVDIGTRPSDKKVVALGYQSTGGVCIYRRSIAKTVWGTDNPKTIKTKIGPGWDQFFKAASQLKAKGYGIVSGDGDLWRMVESSSPTGWVVNGRLNIDPMREKFIDYSKLLKVKGWSNNTQDWNDAWYADMKDANKKKIFSFLWPCVAHQLRYGRQLRQRKNESRGRHLWRLGNLRTSCGFLLGRFMGYRQQGHQEQGSCCRYTGVDHA